MGDHIEDTEDTISLSGLEFEDDNICPEAVFKSNQSSSSSSSSSSFEQDFLGFFSEEWSRDPSYNTSPENIIFCGKIVSSKSSVSHVRKPETSSHTGTLFRSNSDSFRFMKTAYTQSTPRSKSLPNRLPSSSSSSSSCKSKWQVFMFGFGSGKFPSTMDMSDIKSRQLRRHEGKDESVGRRSGKKGWWRLVDVLGCNGGYDGETMVVI
ncbi:hypothetical protein L1987_24957 [Smallanthus sonchifolius]|uniref:Uncharacterized protein n=1 Tax=Smallanthus sonchifolius TaxID=185202 RepID=A0ACB9IMT5_9ASTR|nr:hypothetical protein L1987_24957 [Smallanthus sonchifolius]